MAITEGRKNKQICISFKDTDGDIELYNYIKSKTDKSAYVKDVLKQTLGICDNVNVKHDSKTKEKDKQVGVVNGINSLSQFID